MMFLYWIKMLMFLILIKHIKSWSSASDKLVLSITKLEALDMWRLKMEWNMNSEEHRNQTYEIQVGRTKNMDVIDTISLNAVVNTTIWRSQMPLNCTDHSVRIRHISHNSTLGSWSAWKTHYGNENLSQSKFKMYPEQQVLKEGSTVLFCCVYSEDTNITSLYFKNTPYEAINISPRVKAIRVENITATNSWGVNFYCDKRDETTAYNFITFPPEKPQNITCETKDLRNVNCSWKVRRAHNLGKRFKRMYTLVIRDSEAGSCDSEGLFVSCIFKVIQHWVTYNITLFETNRLGKASEQHVFNITERVFPFPELSKVSAGVLDATVVLQLNGNFEGLSITCQIQVKPGETIQEMQQKGSNVSQRYTFKIKELQPSMNYNTRGRCAIQGNEWGKWTNHGAFVTGHLVTVDVWRQIRGHPNRTVTLLWHTVKTYPELYIEAYEVCKSREGPQRNVCINVTQTPLNLTVDAHVINITVRAVIQAGLSVPSQITIPSAYTGGMLEEKRIMGNAEGFQLSWMRDSTTTCDYIVEWCKLSVPHSIEWRKVPANQTYLTLEAGLFKPGVRYAFTVYGCNAKGHRPHEKQIGYLEEQKPSKFPTLDPNPIVTWSSATLKWSFKEGDPSHTGFITGYKITRQKDFNSDISTSLIDKPHIKSFTFSDLEEDQSYIFLLAACSSAGCGPDTSATIATAKNYPLLLVKISVSLLVLVACCICLCYFRKTLKRIPDKFSFLHLKALDLDEDLYKASEKIRSLKIEDCRWCDVEVLDLHTSLVQKSWLTGTEDPRHSFIAHKVKVPSFTTPSYQLTTGAWDRQNTNLTNFTYVSSGRQDLSEETAKTDGKVQEPNNPLFISDYVTHLCEL
ncbi:leukemia inhibitory factor receptor [Misgurnus anguillicaudatus]|uniref:leukemia inhibitory factor receptor n=1 Tax=Misgurnus anguillicaudatus TaxID=75329 RepID=UPI003CCF0176